MDGVGFPIPFPSREKGLTSNFMVAIGFPLYSTISGICPATYLMCDTSLH